MRILQITPRIPTPPTDGGAVYIYYMSKYLAVNNHKVIMAALISNKHPQEPEKIQKYVKLYSKEGQFKPYNISALIESLIFRKPLTIYHRMRKGLMKPLLDSIQESIDIILLEGLHVARYINVIKKNFPILRLY